METNTSPTLPERSCDRCDTPSASLTNVAVVQGGRRRRLRLCDDCVKIYTNHSPIARPGSDAVAEIFGDNYRDKSFDNFITDWRLFKKYNDLLQDVYGARAAREQSYDREEVESLQQVKTELQSFTDQMAETGGRVVLYGRTGSGKTHLMCGMVRELSDRGITCSGVSLMDFIGRVTDTYSMRRASEEQTKHGMISRLTQADAVFLDDIGATPTSKSVSTNVTWLINEVLRRSQILVVGTQIDHRAMTDPNQGGIGANAVDRLREPPSRYLEITAQSFRGLASRMERHYG
jgi:DNA replication protein DnaC